MSSCPNDYEPIDDGRCLAVVQDKSVDGQCVGRQCKNTQWNLKAHLCKIHFKVYKRTKHVPMYQPNAKKEELDILYGQIKAIKGASSQQDLQDKLATALDLSAKQISTQLEMLKRLVMTKVREIGEVMLYHLSKQNMVTDSYRANVLRILDEGRKSFEGGIAALEPGLIELGVAESDVARLTQKLREADQVISDVMRELESEKRRVQVLERDASMDTVELLTTLLKKEDTLKKQIEDLTSEVAQYPTRQQTAVEDAVFLAKKQAEEELNITRADLEAVQNEVTKLQSQNEILKGILGTLIDEKNVWEREKVQLETKLAEAKQQVNAKADELREKYGEIFQKFLEAIRKQESTANILSDLGAKESDIQSKGDSIIDTIRDLKQKLRVQELTRTQTPVSIFEGESEDESGDESGEEEVNGGEEEVNGGEEEVNGGEEEVNGNEVNGNLTLADVTKPYWPKIQEQGESYELPTTQEKINPRISVLEKLWKKMDDAYSKGVIDWHVAAKRTQPYICKHDTTKTKETCKFAGNIKGTTFISFFKMPQTTFKALYPDLFNNNNVGFTHSTGAVLTWDNLDAVYNELYAKAWKAKVPSTDNNWMRNRAILIYAILNFTWRVELVSKLEVKGKNYDMAIKMLNDLKKKGNLAFFLTDKDNF